MHRFKKQWIILNKEIISVINLNPNEQYLQDQITSILKRIGKLEKYECSNCDGLGNVRGTSSNGYYIIDEKSYIDCEKCKGKGTLI